MIKPLIFPRPLPSIDDFWTSNLCSTKEKKINSETQFISTLKTMIHLKSDLIFGIIPTFDLKKFRLMKKIRPVGHPGLE